MYRIPSRLRTASCRSSTSTSHSSRTPLDINERFRPPRTVRFATSGSNSSKSRLPTFLLATFIPLLTGYVGYLYAQSSKQSEPRDTLKDPQYGSPADRRKGIEELRNTFAHNPEVTVETDPAVLLVHGISENDCHTENYVPDVVVAPQSTEDVVKIVKIANKYKIPVTAYSGGTSLEGQYRGTPWGGICVDMSGMDRILEIHEKDSDLVAQPGAGWMNINDTLKDMGIPLFFPLDPAPTATLGGMLSNGCSGTNAVRYGTAKGEWFLNATVVLPNGEVIKTRRRARKSSAGFDLTKLFAGAEGTLGIITEVTIRLAPVLPTRVAVVHFPDVRKASEAAREIVNSGVGIQCIELVDDTFMRALNAFHSPLPPKYPVLDSLFIKFQGPSLSSLTESGLIAKGVAEKKEFGGVGWKFARDEEEAGEVWRDRKNGHYVTLMMMEGGRIWPTDVCVPVSNLPELVYATKKDIEECGIVSTIVGHIGDGNFHAGLMFKTDEELERIKGVVHRMVKKAIELDGTCTGEHGVGLGKKSYLTSELGEGTVELMRTIKRAVDPGGLFNPGKLYPGSNEGEGRGRG